MDRRDFLKLTSLAGATPLVPLFCWPGSAHAAPLDPRRLRQFVEALPRPARLRGTTLDIAMTEFTQTLHRDLPPTRLWGYAGTYPGPTIEATRGIPTRVTWRNELEAPALTRALLVDQTLHWADPLGTHHHTRSRYTGSVPTVVHLHGAETEPASDGHADAWFTRGFEHTGTAFARQWCEYTNAQPPAMMWYHDHALGITRLNVYAGLAGCYIVRDPELERGLNLPEGEYEREILIQDRAFDTAGQLVYPRRGNHPALHPYWVPEFFGNAIVVNGAVWPYMNVEPRKYRLRLLNGSNARFYRLRLSDGRPFTQIGTDGGFLPAPVEVDTLMLAPAERADVIVDFSGLAQGRMLLLTNNAPVPFPEGEETDLRTVGRIMQFRSVPLAAPDASVIPQKLVDVPALGPASVTRTLTLVEEMGENGPTAVLLDGKRWSEPVTETPRLGTTELWEIYNLTMDTHPIHLHLVNFQILDRRAFRAHDYEKTPAAWRQLERFLQGAPRAPDANERGWKDTVRANPDEVTRILVRFAPRDGGAFPFDATAEPGYMWHCHVLEHEDNEMMRPYKLIA